MAIDTKPATVLSFRWMNAAHDCGSTGVEVVVADKPPMRNRLATVPDEFDEEVAIKPANAMKRPQRDSPAFYRSQPALPLRDACGASASQRSLTSLEVTARHEPIYCAAVVPLRGMAQ